MSYYESLQRQLHYTFHDTHLLEEAFIADGAVNTRNDLDGPPSGNKRLALIGDAVLQLSVLDEWFPSGDTTGERILSVLIDIADDEKRRDIT